LFPTGVGRVPAHESPNEKEGQHTHPNTRGVHKKMGSKKKKTIKAHQTQGLQIF